MTPSRSRRSAPAWFLWAVACLLACLPAVPSAAGPERSQPGTIEELRAARKEAARAKRRILFNNDGNDAVYLTPEPTAEALLACRTTGLLGKPVDTISYCTWCSGFGYFTHRTKIGDVFTCTDVAGAPNGIGFSRNQVGRFLQQGTDPLAIMVDFAKRHGIEIWWSMRMNDTHDRSRAWYSKSLFPPLKQKHPDWLIPPGAPRVTAVDYARPEVRDMALAFLREVCENYDVDGIDLDFYRHLLYFTCNAQGRDAGQEECDLMTELIRRVREMTEEVGLRRGRPILIATRVPDSVGVCRAKGLDIQRWLTEGLIDIMVVSGYVRYNPWEVSVKLGHRYGVPVYPSLDETRMKQPGPRMQIECYRARAMNAYHAGADGIYLFNLFDPNHPAFSELGDPVALETMDKVYTTGARGVLPTYVSQWLANGERFLNRDPVSPERPRQLAPGTPVSIELDVGQDVRPRPEAGLWPRVELALWVVGAAGPQSLSVELNGRPLSDAARGTEDQWFSWPVDPARLVKGQNRFQITLKPGAEPAKATLKDLLLWVRYKREEPPQT